MQVLFKTKYNDDLRFLAKTGEKIRVGLVVRNSHGHLGWALRAFKELSPTIIWRFLDDLHIVRMTFL